MSAAESLQSVPLLELRGVEVRRGEFAVSVDQLLVAPGDAVALLGPSGCGKTTLLLGWTGLLRDVLVTGERRFGDAPWPATDTEPRRQLLAGPVAVILQDARAALDPLQRVGAQVRAVTGAAPGDVASALRELALDDPERVMAARPHEISGGQAQRVLLAIALLRAPRLIVADEPTASLDADSAAEFVAGLRLLQERHGTAVLFATHDQAVADALGARLFAHEAGLFREVSRAERAWDPVPPLQTGEVVLRAAALEHAFGDRPVLRGVDLELRAGETVAVVGPSGCGKTTLARILTGHLAADRGAVEMRGRAQLLFQDAYGSLTPRRTIRSLLRETAVAAFDIEAEAVATGLPADRLDVPADRLSGGERRRAALLRALSVAPPVLVLDEPTASLDPDTARAVIELVLDATRRGHTACVLITHDVRLARAVAHRVLTLRDGVLVE